MNDGLEIILDEMGLKNKEELIDLIKEELCRGGICFKPDDELEIIATSWKEYVEYAKELLEDMCGDCYKANLTIDLEMLADSMLDDMVYRSIIKNDGKTYVFYVKVV